MNVLKLYIPLALLLMVGGITMQAQEQCDTDGLTGLFGCQTAQNTVPFKQPAVVAVEDAWLHYGSDVFGSNLAYNPQGIPFSWAVAFPPSVLQPYDGFVLTRVAFYENEWNLGNLKLSVFYGNEFMPLTLKDEQIFVPTGHVGFCDIVLYNVVEVDPSQYIWVVFSELDMTETYSATFSYDDNPNPNGRWVQMEENKWDDVANYGPWERLQFMIWAYVTDDPYGVEEPFGYSATGVYPNPSHGSLNICTVLSNACLEIYDLTGRLVYNQDITNSVTSVDTESWPSGIYVWRVVAGKESKVGKWVKE